MRRLNEFLQARRLPHPSDLLHPGRLRLQRTVEGNTLLPRVRLSHLARLAGRAPAGAIVECGTFAGGSAAVLARSAPQRELWLFDSWEGCPDPTEFDVNARGVAGTRGDFMATRDRAEELLFDRLSLNRSRVHLVQGWFDETLPATAGSIGPIGLLHVDGDWYESTRVVLDTLFDQVVPGGFVVIDDYGDWMGCRRAVDEFLAERGLDVGDLRQYDMSQAVLRKRA